MTEDPTSLPECIAMLEDSRGRLRRTRRLLRGMFVTTKIDLGLDGKTAVNTNDLEKALQELNSLLEDLDDYLPEEPE